MIGKSSTFAHAFAHFDKSRLKILPFSENPFGMVMLFPFKDRPKIFVVANLN